MSMHRASLVKIPSYLLELSSGNELMGVSQADNSIKIDEIGPIEIPKQITLTSMHIASLVKIPCYFIWSKGRVIYSSYRRKQKYGRVSADNSVKI